MFSAGSGAIGGSTAVAYGRIALVIAILAPLFILFTLFGVQEQREADRAGKAAEKFSFGQIVKTIGRNDQLVWIAVIFLIQQVGNGLVVGGIGSTYIYFTFGYNGGLFSLFNTVGMAATAFLMIFYPAISRRVRRKKLMGMMMAASVIGYVVMLGSALVKEANMGRFWILVMGYRFDYFGKDCFDLVMLSCFMKTVAY